MARQVLSATELRVDGTPLQATLVAAHFPDVEAVKRGEGTIRIDVDSRRAAPDRGSTPAVLPQRQRPRLGCVSG